MGWQGKRASFNANVSCKVCMMKCVREILLQAQAALSCGVDKYACSNIYHCIAWTVIKSPCYHAVTLIVYGIIAANKVTGRWTPITNQ